MTTEKKAVEAKFKSGDKVVINHQEVEITKVDAFGWTAHYGFVWTDCEHGFQQGWMPVILMDLAAFKTN